MFLHNLQDPHAPKIPPWEDLSEELHEEIARAYASLPPGHPRTEGEAIHTIRTASIAWLERMNHETGHEHLVILEMTTNDGNGTVIAGTNHHPGAVRPSPRTSAWMMNPNHHCEVWHNHPDLTTSPTPRGSAPMTSRPWDAPGCSSSLRSTAQANAVPCAFTPTRT